MTQQPDNAPFSNPQPATTPTNVPAVISVIAGLLLCVPGTGVIAIPTGVFGFRKARALGGAGSVAARLGLILGIINLLWWTALFGGAYNTWRSYKLSEPAIKPTKQFVMFVGSGQISAAKALCADSIDETRLTDTAEQMQQWGGIVDINANAGGAYHGPGDIEIRAELKFDNADKFMVTHWAMQGTGDDRRPVLTAYELKDPPSTQPATQPK